MIGLVAAAVLTVADFTHNLFVQAHARHEQLANSGVGYHYLVCQMADADTDNATQLRELLAEGQFNGKSLTLDDRKWVEGEAIYWEGEASKDARECAS